MEFIIENDSLKVVVQSLSGCLKSVFSKRLNRELLWQPDKAWGTQDIVIFPMIALPTFFVDGTEYVCGKRHGILRTEEFELVENLGDKIVIMNTSSEKTLSQYPFEYKFFVTYEVYEHSLKTTYRVVSPSGKNMPFYVGGHAGYYLKNGEGVLKFAKKENADFYPVVQGLVEEATKWELDELQINKELFKKLDTIILSNVDTKNMTLLGNDDLTIKMNLNCPVIAIWSNPDMGDYVCVEPWWGMGDLKIKAEELSKRPFINIINGTKEFSHTLTFEVI